MFRNMRRIPSDTCGFNWVALEIGVAAQCVQKVSLLGCAGDAEITKSESSRVLS